MTTEQINAAIAETMGWYPTPHGAWTRDPAGIAGPHVFDIPNYAESLDAMHEAEKTLGPNEILEYAEILMVRCGSHSCVRATAAQRAEAFLRVKGLWREGK